MFPESDEVLTLLVLNLGGTTSANSAESSDIDASHLLHALPLLFVNKSFLAEHYVMPLERSQAHHYLGVSFSLYSQRSRNAYEQFSSSLTEWIISELQQSPRRPIICARHASTLCGCQSCLVFSVSAAMGPLASTRREVPRRERPFAGDAVTVETLSMMSWLRHRRQVFFLLRCTQPTPSISPCAAAVAFIIDPSRKIFGPYACFEIALIAATFGEGAASAIAAIGRSSVGGFVALFADGGGRAGLRRSKLLRAMMASVGVGKDVVLEVRKEKSKVLISVWRAPPLAERTHPQRGLNFQICTVLQLFVYFAAEAPQRVEEALT